MTWSMGGFFSASTKAIQYFEIIIVQDDSWYCEPMERSRRNCWVALSWLAPSPEKMFALYSPMLAKFTCICWLGAVMVAAPCSDPKVTAPNPPADPADSSGPLCWGKKMLTWETLEYEINVHTLLFWSWSSFLSFRMLIVFSIRFRLDASTSGPFFRFRGFRACSPL